MGRRENQKVALADGYYSIAKWKARRSGKPHTVTLAGINRKFKLKPNQLRNYRANHYSRWSLPPTDPYAAFRPMFGPRYLPLDVWDKTP